jgi:hypothetical protein
MTRVLVVEPFSPQDLPLRVEAAPKPARRVPS